MPMRVVIGSREKEGRRGDEEEDGPLAEAPRERRALAIVLQAIVLCLCLHQHIHATSSIFY